LKEYSQPRWFIHQNTAIMQQIAPYTIIASVLKQLTF